MNKYEELKQRHQQEFSTLPFAYSFGQKSFDEMLERWGLDPENDTDKVYSLGAGVYMQKKDEPLLLEMTKRQKEELDAAIAEDEIGDGFIFDMFSYELKAHEYGLTCDTSETLEALGFTEDQIGADKRLSAGFRLACRALKRSHSMDDYKVKQLKKMFACEYERAKNGGSYGAKLHHPDAEGTNHLTIDAGGLNALIQYYSVFDTDLDRLSDFDARKVYEYNYLLKFAALSRFREDFQDEAHCNLLRSLWTTYCMHWGIDAKSIKHDNELMGVWNRILIHNQLDAMRWKDFASFSLFMSGDLPQE